MRARTTFGQVLDACLSQRSLTLRQAADILGSSAATLSRLRSGQRPPHGLPLDHWASRLDLSPSEQQALSEAALHDLTPPTMRESLNQRPQSGATVPQSHQQAHSDCDGWWLSYHSSFTNDGRIARTLAHLQNGSVRWLSMRDGEPLYSYTGQVLRLGDRLTMTMSEDRGSHELVQITVQVAFDQRRPSLVHGIVAGVSGSSFRRPISLPTAARIVMVHLGSTNDLAANSDNLCRIEKILGAHELKQLGPLWPEHMGEDRSLRRALGLGARDDIDAVLLSLINNRLPQNDHVLWAGAPC